LLHYYDDMTNGIRLLELDFLSNSLRTLESEVCSKKNFF